MKCCAGIVHRDLKSLNLLLDSKWNVKVSDFGLTKFRDELKKGGQGLGQGSIHWTAPEILNEAFGADLALADVYSFGALSPLDPPFTHARILILLLPIKRTQGSSCGSSTPESNPIWA